MEAEVTEDTLILKVNHSKDALKGWLPIAGCLFPFCALPTFLYGWFQYHSLAFIFGAILCIAVLGYPLAMYALAGKSTFQFNLHNPVIVVETKYGINRKLSQLSTEAAHVVYTDRPYERDSRIIELVLHLPHEPTKNQVTLFSTIHSEPSPINPDAERIANLIRKYLPQIRVETNKVTWEPNPPP